MSDLNVYDVFNPPSLHQLKQLSGRYPYQPISEALKLEIESCKNFIHDHMTCIIEHRQSGSECNVGSRSDDRDSSINEQRPPRYAYAHREKYFRLENNPVF